MRCIKNSFIHFDEASVEDEAPLMKRSITCSAMPDKAPSLLKRFASGPISAEEASEVGSPTMISLLRTPSTACPSPQLPSIAAFDSPPASPRAACGARAAPDVPGAAGEPSRSRRPLPFMSLGLPAWAMQLAAEKVRDECEEDCSSWYSPSPASAAGGGETPRTFAFVEASEANASWADLEDDSVLEAWSELAVVQQPSPCSVGALVTGTSCMSPGQARGRKVMWADLQEEEDVDVEDEVHAEPQVHKVMWADLQEEEDEDDEVSAETHARKVGWADLQEAEEEQQESEE